MHQTSSNVTSQVPHVNPNHPFPPKMILTVKQLSDRNPAFSQGSIRALIFNAKPRKSTTGEIPGNGLDDCIVRIGRKLLINEVKFHLWLERQGK
jgi:hypothetical protein